jgi:hypothetical protein
MAGMAIDEGKIEGITRLLESPAALQAHILRVLHENREHESPVAMQASDRVALSSVMLLLGGIRPHDSMPPEICVVLNKRSENVRQSGDLCCPGGAVELRLDRYLAKIASLPGFPLAQWPYWSALRREKPEEALDLALLLATGLRESWEEMRLNPFGIRFLGPLPSHRLVLFRRVIFPMAGWIKHQERFVPSWEVEKIVSIPIRELLNPANYALYRLHIVPHLKEKLPHSMEDHPCFIHRRDGHTEMLWGATYRIVMLFLKMIFGFTPPDPPPLPMVSGVLDEAYLNGRSNRA